MSYVVRPHPSDVAKQIDALPTAARDDFERTPPGSPPLRGLRRH